MNKINREILKKDKRPDGYTIMVIVTAIVTIGVYIVLLLAAGMDWTSFLAVLGIVYFMGKRFFRKGLIKIGPISTTYLIVSIFFAILPLIKYVFTP